MDTIKSLVALDVLRNVALLILICAVFSILPTLFAPHTGEEGVYTISSLEMLLNKQYKIPTLYGAFYTRPPLFNWLILGVAKFLQPQQILLSARLVVMLATVVMALNLIWFTNKLYNNQFLAYLAAAVFLSGDVLFKRGWLAYADPVFAMFIFLAVSLLWVGALEKKRLFIILAAINIILAYLSKIFTAYVFYGTVYLILLCDRRTRAQLLTPLSIIINGLALLFPIFWVKFAHINQLPVMLTETSYLLLAKDYLKWVIKIISFPVDIFLRLMPGSIVTGLILIDNFKQKALQLKNILPKELWLIILLFCLPYWLAPRNHARYLMPIYPFLSLAIAVIIWHSRVIWHKITLYCLSVVVLIRIILGIYYPVYYPKWKGDAQSAAQDILKVTQGVPLYIDDSTSAGLRIAAEINMRRYPTMLSYPISTANKSPMFLLSETSIRENGILYKTYKLKNDNVYLLAFNLNQN